MAQRFVILIAGYNTEEWVGRCLLSALTQNYPREQFRIIFTDDASIDWTARIAGPLIDREQRLGTSITAHFNYARVGALANYVAMISKCGNDEVVVMLDGDDQLAHNGVLETLDRLYSDYPDIWMTYGSYAYDKESRLSDDNCRGIASQVAPHDHTRHADWTISALHTFRPWLFRKILMEHLQYNGEFYRFAWDMALYYPMLEMCGPQHARYIHDILYLYNVMNPLSAAKVETTGGIQREVDTIKSGRYYAPLPTPAHEPRWNRAGTPYAYLEE